MLKFENERRGSGGAGGGGKIQVLLPFRLYYQVGPIY